MFGNPDWFRPKTVGWGLTPIRWQGWAYALTWMGIIGLPFTLMLVWGLVPQSFVWVAVMAGGLLYDVRDIRKQMQRASFNAAAVATRTQAPEKDILYIGDSEAGTTSLATRNYSLKLK